MGNKEIQEERMRGYFIQATKDILKGEGLKALSVRNIADRAGYSYATLYNYFKDVKDLIFECVKDFREEASQFIAEQTHDKEEGTPKIKGICSAYVGYFVQYPGIFELFYLEKMSDIAYRQPTAGFIHNFLGDELKDDLDACIDRQIITPEKAAEMIALLNNLLAGQLLYYLNRRHPQSWTDFMKTVESQINSVIRFYLLS